MIFTYLTIDAKIWLRLWDFITLIQGMAPASPDLFIYLRSKKPAPLELIQKRSAPAELRPCHWQGRVRNLIGCHSAE
jgi:hypothetical protein